MSIDGITSDGITSDDLADWTDPFADVYEADSPIGSESFITLELADEGADLL